MSSQILNLHKKCLLIDAHCDTVLDLYPKPISILGHEFHKRRLGERSDKGHLDIPRMMEGGLDCQIFAIFSAFSATPLRIALGLIDTLFSEVNENSRKISLARRFDEIVTFHKRGKVVALLSIEGGEAIEGDLGVLRMFYELGVRLMTLTWMYRNRIADGTGETRTKGGLSRFGVSVVEEMNKLGMIIDISHINYEGFFDVLEVTKSPPIASHSNCRALCEHPQFPQRNLTDKQIHALAEKGGVIGINFAPSLLSNGIADVSSVVDHIDHIVNLVGIDHVGFGSDFDGIKSTPKGLEDVTKFPSITKCLVDGGYSDKDIEKILGGNFLRVFQSVLK